MSCVVLAGCAAKPRPAPVGDVALAPMYEPAAATALVFDPPVTSEEPVLDLSRESRAAGAFVGFEEITSSVSYVRTDDRQTNDLRDRFERRAIIERIGVRSR